MSNAATTRGGAVRPTRSPLWIVERGILALLTVVVFAGFAIHSPVMATNANIANILVQTSYLAIFAAAQALVIMTRGFDLSLGSAVSTVSILCALTMTTLAAQGAGVSAVLAGLVVALAAGGAIGGLNGFFVAWGGINPFIVTLGSMNILLTLSTTISGGFPVAPLPEAFRALAYAEPAGIPLSVLCAALALVGLQIALSRTVFGRAVLLIGSNARATIMGGMAYRFHLVSAYVVCSALVGLGAFLMTARTGSGEPNLGGNLTLETIAAAVLGGIRLRGGQGDMLAPLLGAVFVTVLSNGMNLAGIDGYLQGVFLGLVIIAALSLDRLRSKASA
ncbi:ABC transporter permease [Marinimicrococcus flavescens]|uniref:ABC transporter permease n=1 Tax=Marinimicrococcus flavescens TaxID=3031815 RepID=A0AAP3XRR2_9PROT|nr:ABC transporter permease [Marinimicrococcus flavescens]